MPATHKVWSSRASEDFSSVTPLEGVRWVPSPEWSQSASCEATSALPLADNVHGAGVPLVSSRLRQWLESRVEVRFHRVVVRRRAGLAEERFAIEALEHRNCISWGRSLVTWYRDQPFLAATSAKKLVTYQSNLTGGGVVCPLGMPTVVLTPVSVIAKIPRRFTGLEFQSLESFRFELALRPDRGVKTLERRVLARVEAIALEAARRVPGRPTDTRELARFVDEAWFQEALPTLQEVEFESDSEALAIAEQLGPAVFEKAFVGELRRRAQTRKS